MPSLSAFPHSSPHPAQKKTQEQCPGQNNADQKYQNLYIRSISCCNRLCFLSFLWLFRTFRFFLFYLLFLLLFRFATITSSVVMLEINVGNVTNQNNKKRAKWSQIIGLLTFVFGIPSALSYGILSKWTLFGKSFFDCMDFIVICPSNNELI